MIDKSFNSGVYSFHVLSLFRNHYINFTLFFFENEAKSSDIINVIESSAPKVQKDSTNVALVDKFELELDSVKVKMERQLEPETFNKNSFTPPPPLVAETIKPTKATDKPTRKITTEASPPQEPTTTISPTPTRKEAPPEDGPSKLSFYRFSGSLDADPLFRILG